MHVVCLIPRACGARLPGDVVMWVVSRRLTTHITTSPGRREKKLHPADERRNCTRQTREATASCRREKQLHIELVTRWQG